MTDEEILDAIVRRIGDQAPDAATTIHCARQPNGTFRLTHLDGTNLGSLSVGRGQVAVTLAKEQHLTLPAIPGRPLTEADIDAAAEMIVEAAKG
jgi:hypothetical protein